MSNIKFFICPSTKNIVHAVISFNELETDNIGLIPTRRQVDWNGGYANNWTTKDFCEYTRDVFLGRDHAGPLQGYKEDDGYESLAYDCNHFNLIHLDPWKKFPVYKDGLQATVNMLEFCFEKNCNIEYEIGTEEGIRPFTIDETKTFLKDLYQILDFDIFKKIKFIVVQSGTIVKETKNFGQHDPKKLKETIKLAKEYNLSTKEHNGDYLGYSLIKEKMDIGLDSINIGPEISVIETQTYLDIINSKMFDTYWKLCYDSHRWERWVNKNFNPVENKRKLIEICGHYVVTTPTFINEIKNNLPNIDDIIQSNILNHLKLLIYGRD